jgi:peptide/nickel transport system permease protein
LQSRLVRLFKSSYLRKRILSSIIVFFAIYILNFILPRLVPGEFVSGIVQGTTLDPQARAQVIQMFGLDEPLSVQFVKYVEQTFSGIPPDFGVSFSRYPDTVWDVVSQYLPWTLFLITTSQLIAWFGGLLLGAWLGWTPGSRKNSVVFLTSTFFWGVPSYWLAEILIFLFAIRTRLFPPALTSGVATGNVWVAFPAILNHSFLPILTLVILSLPVQAMVMRNSMVNVMKEDFITAAVARGLGRWSLAFRHAARNAMLPMITNLALSFGAILSGAYLIEIVYSYPGMGLLIYQAVLTHDYPVLQGVFFFSALVVIVANLVGDFAYQLLDPRIEYEGTGA